MNKGFEFILDDNQDIRPLPSEQQALIRWAFSEDLVKAVRCKECKFLVKTEGGEYNPNDIVCDYWATDGLKENDFCSRGERRGDNGCL